MKDKKKIEILLTVIERVLLKILGRISVKYMKRRSATRAGIVIDKKVRGNTRADAEKS